MIQFYKPNPRVTGSACSFRGDTVEGNVFVSLLKQASWDDNAKIGSFKANKDDKSKVANIKLNFNEAAAILDCIERNRPFSTYHKTEAQKVGINFKPYMKEVEGKQTQVGFSFSMSKEAGDTKESFLIGFTFAEARHIREYLIAVMQNYYSRLFISNEKRFKKTEKEEAPAIEEAPVDDTSLE
jgi:hypothetical protein